MRYVRGRDLGELAAAQQHVRHAQQLERLFLQVHHTKHRHHTDKQRSVSDLEQAQAQAHTSAG